MTNIEARLEAWKNKLLDLGKRNKLLNYRDTKRSNLRIITPDMFELWQSLVVGESPLEFDYFDDEQNYFSDTKYEAEEGRKVITNQSIREQQKTLRNIRDKAKTIMEEQGVNVLYLAFGFLKWCESSNSDQYFSSPLILVPVTLL